MQNNKNISQILRYLNNELSEKERYAFEREMEADPFLMDAVEGYEKLSKSETNNSLLFLQNKLQSNTRKNTISYWTKIAATIIFLVGISTLFYITTNKETQPLLSKQQNNKPIIEQKDSSENRIELPTKNNTIEIHASDTLEIESSARPAIPDSNEKTEEKPLIIAKLSHKKANYNISQSSVNKEISVDLEQQLELDSDRNKNTITGTIEGDKMDLTSTSYAADRAIDQSILKDSFIQYKGKVVDENGIPIPGVTIIEEGKPNGTITDMDGNFTLNTLKNESLLSFDFIGFKQKKLVAKNDSIGEVVLENETLALDEVVTIGYGTKPKNRTTEKSEEVKNNLIPTPLIGIKRFKRKIEHSLKLPDNYPTNEIRVNIFITDSGKISDIKIITPVNQEFDLKLIEKIKEQGDWETAIINNKPTKGSRLVIFEF